MHGGIEAETKCGFHFEVEFRLRSRRSSSAHERSRQSGFGFGQGFSSSVTTAFGRGLRVKFQMKTEKQAGAKRKLRNSWFMGFKVRSSAVQGSRFSLQKLNPTPAPMT